MSSDVIQIGSAKLIHGDCREILPFIQREISAFVFDPPYGIDYVHNGHGQSIHAAMGRRRNGREMARGCARNANKPIAGDRDTFDPTHVLQYHKPALMFGANHYAQHIPSGKLLDGKASGYGWFTWNKNPAGRGPADNFTDGEFGWANFSIKRNVLEYLWKGVACEKLLEENGERYHPTTKPQGVMLKCVQWIIAAHCYLRIDDPSDTQTLVVCDPYMGSGSTGVACATLGIPFIGIELDPDHFETACERLTRAHAQGKLFPATARAMASDTPIGARAP